ncbi:MAG: 1-deoxy-D-xylulose-5-phosphate synthase [Spirochaetales bacterium]|nr:1-deoxy-D-xylulose-5-phosphate synthase [Spirochaetales bacterium]
MKNKYPLLNTIQGLDDFKKLPEKDYPQLVSEIREYIIDVVSKNGGHLASNLGVVELTIALHSVFDSPRDKIIWDVGHQCYTHKILTGRKDLFKTLRTYRGLSGFPKKSESPHDVFETGHSSTSISAGLGMVAAREISGTTNKIVAIIGDGALTGGMALEALNHAGHLGKNLILILNDNNMSISKNVGALSAYLSKLSATRSYQHLRKSIYLAFQKTPILGKVLIELVRRVKKAMKAFLFNTNLFTDFGFEYVGPVDGHNINELIPILKKIKDIESPVVLHVSTCKGKGYSPAEFNPTQFHGIGAFSIIDGKVEKKNTITYTQAFSNIITTLAEKDKKIVAISAAMTHGTGLDTFAKEFPDRFFDVGICEQHAVTFAAGLATSGLIPFIAIYSTFMQRAVDQVIHDVALQKLHVIFCMDRSGLVGNDGETHHGIFDIALFRCIPGITLLSPYNIVDMNAAMMYAYKAQGPVLIRYPRGVCTSDHLIADKPYIPGQGVFVGKRNGEFLLITVGSILGNVIEASRLLQGDNIFCDIYHLRFIKPIDFSFLSLIADSYKHIFIIEDGVLNGGVGEHIEHRLSRQNPDLLFELIGIPDEFITHGSQEQLLKYCGLSPLDIARKVKENLKQYKSFTLVKNGT